MARYILGLDMGITSVGWGIIDAESGEIIDKGVRLFEEGTASNNATRREKRGSRRLKRRKQQRITEIKRLLKKENILTSSYKPLNNVYELRCKGLKEKLTNDELVTVILNIAKKRGSSFDVVEDDENIKKDSEKSSKANLTKNEKVLNDENYFICEKQLEDLKEKGKVRGITNIFKSSSYEKELRAILDKQELSNELKEQIIKRIFSRRDFNDGPGSITSPTIFGRFIPQPNGEIIKVGSMIEKMRGKCSVFPDKPRASKMSYTADLFNILNDLNNLRIDREDDIDYVTEEEKNIVINDYIRKKGKITIKELCNKVLGVDETNVSGFREKGDKSVITEFGGYQKILKALNKEILPIDEVDAIIDILTEHKEVERRKELLRQKYYSELNEDKITSLANISGIKEYHALSYDAMKLMIPELLTTNDNQMQILTRMNLVQKNKFNLANRSTIPSFSDQIYSPVAKRVHNETIKVVNAVIKQYGELDSIVIEMARDRNSDEQKKRITEANKKGLKLNEEAKELIMNETVGYRADQKLKTTPKLVQKIRFYKEQDGKCLYSGKQIDLQRLITDPEAYEIDHIIPLSISFDDSANNKVLVLKEQNQRKLNRTPFQYLSSHQNSGWSYGEYEGYVLKMYQAKRISKRKLQNLLNKSDITKEEVRKSFIERNLVDTRYASRVVLNLLQNYFKANNKNTKVFTIRGQITSLFRKSRRLDKTRDNFYHHIVDALIVAYSRKFNYINELMQYGFKYSEKIDEMTGEVIQDSYDLFDYKNDNFTSKLRKINELNAYDEDIKISHKVDRKPNRQFTDETIYSVKNVDGVDMRISKYKNIYDADGVKFAKEIKDSLDNEEKLNKFLMKREDPVTFQLLVDIVKNTTCDAKESPFKKYCEENGLDSIRKRSKKGLGPKITSIRYYNEKLGNHLNISQKYINLPNSKKVVLLQVSPYRTDFYKNQDGLYKFVTLRYIHFRANKDGMYIPMDTYQELKRNKKIDDTFEFQFSLYRNECLKIVKADEFEESSEIYRFVGTSDDKANKIEVKPMYCKKLEDKSQITFTIGKKIKSIVKYDVDVLGNRFAKKRDKNLQFDF